MGSADTIRAFVEGQQNQWLDELKEFLRIPSISTDPDHADHVDMAAEWLGDKLREAGCTEVEKWPTEGHPVIYGAWRKASGAPTLLVYGHYDLRNPSSFGTHHRSTPPFGTASSLLVAPLTTKGSCIFT